MLMLIKRVLAATIVIAAVAAPTTAYARSNGNPLGATDVPVTSPTTTTAHLAGPSATTSSSGFRWADAGIGAGSLLMLIGVGGAAAVVYRRRVHPLAS
ncbi:MAG TPA: hypothetical protein VHW96_05765 [Solirubrobacteraceae bacterium]|nr:hypothetical protein [Solirubrobacteraceae bacterium]